MPENIPPKAFTSERNTNGFVGESVVAFMLQNRGWRMITRNWRDRYTEIDLVMQDTQGGLHFIEVKTRKKLKSRQGHLLEMLPQRQIARLRKAVPRYLATLPVDIPRGFCHIDAAFVHLTNAKAFVSFFPDCHV